MRIGVDATSWGNRRGYGRYTRALLTAVVELDRANEYTFFVDREAAEFPLPAGVEVCRISTRVATTEAAGANSHRSLSDLWAVAAAMRRAKVDLIYFPTDYTYVPLYVGVPRLVTIHDTIFAQFSNLVFPSLRSKIFYQAKIRSGIRQARLLITVSEFSRRQLVKRLRIPPSRLRVVSEAADPTFRPMQSPRGDELMRQLGVPSGARCLVYVGGFSPHKNLSMLLGVLGDLLRRDGLADVKLLLVGDYAGDSFHSCYRELAEQVQRDKLQEHVVFTGRMKDEDLVVLLNRCQALVLPSLAEGFGLPAVEAAACGRPVLATTESPLPQLLGEGMLAVDPCDRVGWSNAIERVLSDGALRRRMSRAALAAASRLSWTKSARQLLSVFDEVEPHAAAA